MSDAGYASDTSPFSVDATAITDLLRQGDTQGAVAMAESVGTSSGVVELRAAQGMAFLAAHRDAEALVVLKQATAEGDSSRVTAMNLALAVGRGGDVALAETLIADVATRFPEWDEPPLRLAESLRRRGQHRDCEAAYRNTLAANPARAEALLGLAGLLITRGAVAEARDLARRCCVVDPGRAEAWDVLGVSLLLSNDAPLAEAAFARAQGLAPADLAIAIRRIEATILAGTVQAELVRLERAALQDPLNATLLAGRAMLLGRLKQPDAAIELLEAACALEPESPKLAKLYGLALMNTTDIRRAEAQLRRALDLSPDDLLLKRNYAPSLLRLQRRREARDYLQNLITEHGETTGDLGNLSTALTALGLQKEGVRAARRAIELAPQAHFGWRILSSALPYDDAVTAADLSNVCRECGSRAPRAAADRTESFVPATVGRERRIRVGLLSMDLRSHPVGWLTVAGFEALDAAAFEIVCFGQPHSDDLLQRRFRAVASEWHVMNPNDLDAVVAVVREASIDILVDLGGYGDRGMMAACASRLAPVQIKWVGAQNHTTGLDEMDWFVTDRWETPPGFEYLYTERLLRLPDGYVCYSPPAYAPDVGALPALRSDYITFGCFNNLAKITPRALAVWATILRRLPRSRLIIKSHVLSDFHTRDEVRSRFATLCIDDGRLELRGRSSHRVLLAEYNDIDIALDPFPYSGGLTTCEALWMGVPTVTLSGETFSSRHSTSHMSNVGMEDWVASDVSEYERIAVARATDIRALEVVRAGLRRRVGASPLCDAQRFGRALAAALHGVWQDRCGRPLDLPQKSGGIGSVGGRPLELHRADVVDGRMAPDGL